MSSKNRNFLFINRTSKFFTQNSQLCSIINSFGGACGMGVIVVGNGHSDPSSNPGLWKGMNNYSPSSYG